MFGVRLAPLLGRTLTRTIPQYSVPKFQYSLANQESVSLFQRTQVLPSNLIIKNMLQILEKMKEQSQQDSEKDITNLTLVNQGTVRMSHVKICTS